MDEDFSILNSVKKMIGISSDYKVFDQDLIVHINSVFMILHQLGIGPKNGFSITDENTVWTDFVSDESNLHAVKTYMHLKVKLLFDPPLSTAVMECYKEQIKELEWRLNVQVEGGQNDTE